MHRVLRLLDGLGRRPWLFLLLGASATVFGAVIVTVVQLTTLTGGYGVLDFDIGYDPARVMTVLGSYGAEGMALNARVQALDLVNPLLYATVMAVFTRMVWRGKGPEWLALLPYLAALGDYAENITLFLMAQRFPEVSEHIVSVSSTLSLLNNAMMPIAAGPLVVGIVLKAVKRL